MMACTVLHNLGIDAGQQNERRKGDTAPPVFRNRRMILGRCDKIPGTQMSQDNGSRGQSKVVYSVQSNLVGGHAGATVEIARVMPCFIAGFFVMRR